MVVYIYASVEIIAARINSNNIAVVTGIIINLPKALKNVTIIGFAA